jgi:hypothetical protein
MRRIAILMVAIALLNVGLALLPLLKGQPVRNWDTLIIFSALILMYSGRLFGRKSPPAALDPAATVGFHRSLLEHTLEILGTVALAAAGLFFLWRGETVSGAIMAGVGILGAAMILARGRSELQMSPAGLDVKGLKSGTIPWESIGSIKVARTVAFADSGTVTIDLRETSAWKPKPQRRIPIIHPAKVDPDGARITLYSDFFGTNLSTLDAALTARQQLLTF